MEITNMAETYIRQKPKLGIDIEQIKMLAEFLAKRCSMHGVEYLGGILFCKTHYNFMIHAHNADYQFILEKCNGNDNKFLLSYSLAEEQDFHPIQLLQYQNCFELSTDIWKWISTIF